MSVGVLYRILHADSFEPVELDGRFGYPLGMVEAEVRERPEQFALTPDPSDAVPHGLIVRRVLYDPAGDEPVTLLAIDSDVRDHLELLRLRELARHAVEVWRGGPAMFDAEEFESAMARCPRRCRPGRARRSRFAPDDPF